MPEWHVLVQAPLHAAGFENEVGVYIQFPLQFNGQPEGKTLHLSV